MTNKLIVGLGNPGEKYSRSRHNVGFMVIDELARRMVNEKWAMVKKFDSLTIKFQSSIIFCKPQTFMNASGVAVKKLADFYKIKVPDIWVIHDDLDINLGEYKIQKGVGPKLHYGIESIDKALGTGQYWRVRVGVDNRANNNEQRTKGEEYVLQNFTNEETEIVKSVIGKVVNDLIIRFSVRV
jgi:PTH1 family peptidyl-tRNA hydrolase